MLCTQSPAIAGTRKARGRQCMKQQQFTVIGRDAGWQDDGGWRGLEGGRGVVSRERRQKEQLPESSSDTGGVQKPGRESGRHGGRFLPATLN